MRRLSVFVALFSMVLVSISWGGDGGSSEHDQTRPAPIEVAGITVTRGYTFLLHRPDGNPVRWPPCPPHAYTINPAHAPPGGDTAIHEAFRQMAQATGLTWHFEGYTPATTHDGQPHVIVVFESPASGAPGAAQPVAVDGWYVAGLIRLDPTHATHLPLSLHEVGHIAGLDHVDTPDQIMSHTPRTHYGTGDQAGLQHLGGTCTGPQ